MNIETLKTGNPTSYLHQYEDGEYIHFPKAISKMEDFSLAGVTLPTILIPDGIDTIGRAALFASRAENISLPDTLKVIEDDAFAGCTCLKELFLPDSLESIGARAFMGCISLRSVVIPKNVKKIGDEAFAFCKNLQHVTLPETSIETGKDIFLDCPLNP